MPPSLALLIWFIFLLAVLAFDPAKDPGVSVALWVPLTWMFILGSRLPSQWLGGESATSAAAALEEGNPLDRSIFFVLILLAIGILISRSFKWRDFFAHNIILMAFLSFALVSVVWSDFPFVSFKRWFRDLGNYLVILVALSDRHPTEALRTLVRRLCYLLIPLSVVLIKYYPQLSRCYDDFTGAVAYSGVTTTKDMLGVVGLISGIFFFWDTVTRWSARKERRTKRIVAVNFALIGMTLWLLKLADCATCKVCLAVGCLVILVAHSRAVRRHPGPLKVLIPVGICLCYFLLFGTNMKASMAEAVGRDPTLTARTLLWSYLLGTKINSVVGTGYDSFWLGPRLEHIAAQFAFLPTQAHNGFIEVYLNLGFIGLFLMILFLISSYRTICRRLAQPSDVASLGLALWAILLLDNTTSASFGKTDLLWLAFLLVAIAAPERADDRLRSATPFEKPNPANRLVRLPLETANPRGDGLGQPRSGIGSSKNF